MNVSDLMASARHDAAEGRFTEAAKKTLAVLRQTPASLEALDLYGALAIRLRRPQDAISIFGRALQVDPKHWVAHAQLASLYFQEGDYLAAAHHAHSAIAQNPRAADPYTVLGSILLSQKREREAKAHFETARALVPDGERVDSAYATALVFNGDFAEAGEILRRLIAQHPEQSRYYALLAQLRKLQAGDSDAALIRSLLDANGRITHKYPSDSDERVWAYMALYKLESDLGNYRQAFPYLQAAKATLKARHPFSPEDSERRHREIRTAFDTDFFARRASVGFLAEDPIFVVGMPRSGTTLLEQILCSHPQVRGAGELMLARRLQDGACARFGAGPSDLEALKRVPAEVWKQLGEEYVRQARLRVPEGRYFIDKMPGNYLGLGFIRTMLPRARIIHLRRHPVATCLSIYEQNFATPLGYSNDLRWLGRQYLQYRGLMDHWNGLFGEAIVELDYEALVSECEGTLGWLADRLGLEQDGRELDHLKTDSRILTASLWQARQPIHCDSVARWRRYEQQLQPLLEELAPVLGEKA